MTIVSFIDGSIYARSVVDHTAWLARAHNADVELVHIVASNDLRAEQVAQMHPTGPVLLAADPLLDARIDELTAQGRAQLAEARDRLAEAGVFGVRTRLLEGPVARHMAEAAGRATLIVAGKRGEHADLARLPLGANLERLARHAPAPVLAVPRRFRPTGRMLLAIDVTETPSRAVDALAQGALPPAPLHLLHVGPRTDEARAALDAAVQQLQAAGFPVSSEIAPGDPRHVVPQRIVSDEIDLLAIGASSAPRLKSLILGSLATDLTRACQVPVLLC